MGSLTHSRRPNGRDTPHHIRCLSCRSGFFDDLLPTAVPGLDTNAGGTLCSIVPSVSGHPRRRGTGPGPRGARTVSQGGADSDSSMLLTHPCPGPDARPGRSSSPMRPAVCTRREGHSSTVPEPCPRPPVLLLGTQTDRVPCFWDRFTEQFSGHFMVSRLCGQLRPFDSGRPQSLLRSFAPTPLTTL